MTNFCSKCKIYKFLMRPARNYPTVNNRSYNFVSCPIFHNEWFCSSSILTMTHNTSNWFWTNFLFLFILFDKNKCIFWRTDNIIWQLKSNKIDKCHLQLMVKPQIFHRHNNLESLFYPSHIFSQFFYFVMFLFKPKLIPLVYYQDWT